MMMIYADNESMVNVPLPSPLILSQFDVYDCGQHGLGMG